MGLTQENKGCIEVPNTMLICDPVVVLREMKTETCFKWVKGCSGHPRNDRAGKLANKGAISQNNQDFMLEIDSRLRIMRVCLQSISQKLAYRAIRIKKMSKYIPQLCTIEQLEYAKAVAEEAFGDRPMDARLWSSLKHKDIAWNIRYTLWMMAYNAYMVGTNWLQPD
ncbi:hypothetical protein DFS33DRAFT_1248830 [Desarmillaria ectypa]|nr:hypothetical protein DFS33DRAFT_1248830 [Desarmillaria ectypa]